MMVLETGVPLQNGSRIMACQHPAELCDLEPILEFFARPT
jgi:hypothetical protein